MFMPLDQKQLLFKLIAEKCKLRENHQQFARNCAVQLWKQSFTFGAYYILFITGVTLRRIKALYEIFTTLLELIIVYYGKYFTYCCVSK